MCDQIAKTTTAPRDVRYEIFTSPCLMFYLWLISIDVCRGLSELGLKIDLRWSLFWSIISANVFILITEELSQTNIKHMLCFSVVRVAVYQLSQTCNSIWRHSVTSRLYHLITYFPSLYYRKGTFSQTISNTIAIVKFIVHWRFFIGNFVF